VNALEHNKRAINDGKRALKIFETGIEDVDKVTGGFVNTLKLLAAWYVTGKVLNYANSIRKSLTSAYEAGAKAVTMFRRTTEVQNAAVVASSEEAGVAVDAAFPWIAIAQIAVIATIEIVTHWKTVKRWFGDFWGYMKDTGRAAWAFLIDIGKGAVYVLLQAATAGIRGILEVASHLPFVGDKARDALDSINDYLHKWKPDFSNVTTRSARAGPAPATRSRTPPSERHEPARRLRPRPPRRPTRPDARRPHHDRRRRILDPARARPDRLHRARQPVPVRRRAVLVVADRLLRPDGRDLRQVRDPAAAAKRGAVLGGADQEPQAARSRRPRLLRRRPPRPRRHVRRQRQRPRGSAHRRPRQGHPAQELRLERRERTLVGAEGQAHTRRAEAAPQTADRCRPAGTSKSRPRSPQPPRARAAARQQVDDHRHRGGRSRPSCETCRKTSTPSKKPRSRTSSSSADLHVGMSQAELAKDRAALATLGQGAARRNQEERRRREKGRRKSTRARSRPPHRQPPQQAGLPAGQPTSTIINARSDEQWSKMQRKFDEQTQTGLQQFVVAQTPEEKALADFQAQLQAQQAAQTNAQLQSDLAAAIASGDPARSRRRRTRSTSSSSKTSSQRCRRRPSDSRAAADAKTQQQQDEYQQQRDDQWQACNDQHDDQVAMFDADLKLWQTALHNKSKTWAQFLHWLKNNPISAAVDGGTIDNPITYTQPTIDSQPTSGGGGSGSGGGGGGGGGGGKPPPIPVFARGGIHLRPTYGMYGDQGPEATIPLTGQHGQAAISQLARAIVTAAGGVGGQPGTVIYGTFLGATEKQVGRALEGLVTPAQRRVVRYNAPL
jgi:hypothetical protein